MDLTEAQKQQMVTAGLNLIGQALSIYDRNLRLAISNERFREMFRLPDVLAQPGASFEDTIRYLATTGEYGPIDDTDAFVRARVEQARAFEPHYMERTRSNGRTISVEGSPLPQGGWIAVYTDITRAKRVEGLLRARSEELTDQLLSHTEELSTANRELAAANTALAEAKRQVTEIEAHTRLTTEMMPAHIAHVDGTGTYTYSNRKIGTVVPDCDPHIVGRHIGDVLGAENFAMIREHLSAAFDGESPVFEFAEKQSSRRIRVAMTPDRAGGAYILSMDVTEETQARSALQQSRRRALAAQLTSGLAHDFSNLLTIILGLQSKLLKAETEPSAKELIIATQAAARRGGRLLNRIADMSGRKLRPVATAMGGFLDDIKTLAQPSLPQAIGLSVLDITGNARLMLDAGMLQDALLNLILNARDACGSSGQITVSAHLVRGTWLEIAVTDTGPGFTDESLEKAMHPFFTTKGGEGSGLGLAMVYDMVKLAGGQMRLRNDPSGANVSLRLPYRAAPDTGGGLALLVEDSADLRPVFRDMLIDLGYGVIEAGSVDEALAIFLDLPDIALVLSDLQLAGASTGIELIDRLGQAGPPCVLMTSLPEEHPLHLTALTRAPVLRKPFGHSALAALIHTEVEQ